MYNDQRSSGCLDMGVQGSGELEGWITKVQEAIFEGSGYVHYLDCSDGLEGIHLLKHIQFYLNVSNIL